MKQLTKITLVLASVLVITQSCKKDYFDINTNPNNVTETNVSYDVVLAGAMANTGRVVATQWGFLQNWMGYWARSGSFSANSIEETYNITTGFGNGIWNGFMDNNYDYKVVVEKAKAAGGTFYEGIARTMLAHNNQILVDIYNNIPYKQFGRGVQGNLTPAYDNGLDVYKDLFRQLDTAITLFRSSNNVGPNKDIELNDLIYAGDTTKWIRFANTLKLRMVLHLFKLSGAEFDRASELTKIINEPNGFIVAGESASIFSPIYVAKNNNTYRQDKPNPFYNLYIKNTAGNVTSSNSYYAANSWGLGYYTWNGDLRRNYFYAPTGGSGSNYVGVAYGLPPLTSNAAASLSLIGVGLGRSFAQPQWILTSVESLLLQAEARQRGFIPGNAATMLNSAVVESFTWLQVPNAASAASSYLTNNATYTDVDIDAASVPTSATATATGDKNYTILSHKFYALNGIAPFEIWTDVRRTDIVYGGGNGGYEVGPKLSVAPGVGANKIPTRLMYPQNEYNFNAAAVSAQGTITAQSKIFWDK